MYMHQKIRYSLASLLLVGFLFCACLLVLNVQNSSATTMIDTYDKIARASQKINNQTGLKTGLHSDQPVLVEMFLSQSCSSCVPAARYVRELAKRDDIVTLAWHVDYWDKLVVRGHGRWKDPYSDRTYTNRQRDYRLNTSTGGRIYTPQAVINGQLEAVGSRKDKVEKLISQQPSTGAKLVLTRNGTQLHGDIEGPDENYEIMLVSFHKQTTTSILGGENAGRNWNEANVVTKVRNLGNNLNTTLSSDEFNDTIGCAVLVQEANLGSVIAAAYCPA